MLSKERGKDQEALNALQSENKRVNDNATMFEDIDLDAIEEENARELVKRLLNMIEQFKGLHKISCQLSL